MSWGFGTLQRPLLKTMEAPMRHEFPLVLLCPPMHEPHSPPVCQTRSKQGRHAACGKPSTHRDHCC
jgi:hypothetical protein